MHIAQSKIYSLSALWLAISLCIVSFSPNVAAKEDSDEVMTEENLEQLQNLLVKYSKYKNQVRESGEEVEKPKKPPSRRTPSSKKKSRRQRAAQVEQSDDNRQEARPVGTKRVARSAHKQLVDAQRKPKAPEDLSAFCCGCSDNDEESTYSYLVNSLYSWYYGAEEKAEDENLNNSDEENKREEAEEEEEHSGEETDHFAEISDYIEENGHAFNHNVDELREKDLRLLMKILHSKESALPTSHKKHPTGKFTPEHSSRSPVLPKEQKSTADKQDIEQSGYSSTQKGIFAGVITAVCLLLIAGLAFFLIQKYGLPNKFVSQSRFTTSSRRRSEREQPLRPPGPNVGHIYPAP